MNKRAYNRAILSSGLTVLMVVSGMASAAAGGFDNPITNQALNQQRGRQDSTFLNLTAAASQLDGQLRDNVAKNTNNGQNVIDGNAFSGLSGNATVIQNSGNNNIIQDSTIYNISITP